MVYADYNGSAPLCSDVKEYLIKRMQDDKGPFANPNSSHHIGQKVLTGMENARSVCAKALGAKYGQVIFNSGATEGITTVFYSLLDNAIDEGKNVIITSGIEHSAVSNTAEYYRDRHNYHWEVLKTKPSGVVDIEHLGELLEQHTPSVAMVSVMAANNETGVIQPYRKMADICHEYDVPLFCDTTQIVGKAPFNFAESNVDYAVMSGHKIGAMTGVGIVMAKDKKTLKPLIIGGGQEKGLRGGTQNYLAIETLAVALDAIQKNFERVDELQNKRLSFEANIKEKFPNVVIIGEGSERLATTTYISLPGVHAQAVQIELESQDIYVTTSSACSDNEPVTSKVLKSMGVSDDVGRGVVRISLGLCASLEDYDRIENALTKAYEKLTQIKSY